MNAFQTIIQKYYGQDKVFSLTKNDGSNSLEFLQYIYKNNHNNKTNAAGFFYYYILQILVDADDDDDEFIYKKFNELKKLVINPFMSETIANALLDDFCQFQRIYNGFAKLARIYKFKKAKVQITTDLCANELNPKKSNVFVLFQNNLKYYFSARDLINIINSNLSHCVGFVPDMIVSKNPYNNLILSDTCLYNIYFFLRWNSYIIPELFHGFFLSNFNATTFHYNYEFNIINEHIKNFIYNSHHDTLYPIFTEMWDAYYRITRKILIDVEFPKDKLINIMKPYLHLYYTSLYATNGTYKQCNAEYTLRRKLMRFRNFNPLFGRKYVRFNKDILGKRHRRVEFDLKHINFYNSSFENNNQLRVEHDHRTPRGPQSMVIRFYGVLDSLRSLPNPTPGRVPSPSFETNNDSSLGGDWYSSEPIQENDISNEPSHDEIDIYNEDQDYDDTDDDEEEEEKEDDLSIS
jgi:hypothetical protein